MHNKNVILTECQQNDIIKTFPKIELSYETYHNKVLQEKDGDVFLAIPQGKKYFAWLKSLFECILLEIVENKKICDITIYSVEYAHSKHVNTPKGGGYSAGYGTGTGTGIGTIFYGTLFSFENDKRQCFCIEDVYYYMNKNVCNYPFLNKLDLFHDFFNSGINQNNSDNVDILFGLPIITTNITEIYTIVKSLPYKIKNIQYYNQNGRKYNAYITNTYINTTLPKKEIVFRVRPDSTNDIYHLYNVDKISKKEVFYDIAYIPSYTTSVMMNNIFRKIKENGNLDLLEESDDEEEFENEDPHKFVNLDKFCNMNCIYNSRFKKWTPVSIAPNNGQL